MQVGLLIKHHASKETYIMPTERLSASHFTEVLLKTIRQSYDPDARKVFLLGCGGLLIQLRFLGEISGLITIWPGNRLYAYFRSRPVVASRNWRKIDSLLLEENRRFSCNTWVWHASGELTIRVDGLKLRGSTNLRLRSIRRRLFHRFEVMDRRIHSCFVRRGFA